MVVVMPKTDSKPEFLNPNEAHAVIAQGQSRRWQAEFMEERKAPPESK